MASSYTLLADLRGGRCSNIAEVRLLRFLEARNVRKRGDLMSLDENSTLIQGSISSIRQLKFRERLREGPVYTLSGFDVTRSNPNNRLSDAPLSIRFSDGTSFDKLTESIRPIPTEMFQFRSYNQLLELANRVKQLPDTIGELTAIRSTITARILGAQRVMLTLQLKIGDNICVSMFDSMELEFHSKFDSYGKEPKTVLATGVNPKIVGISQADNKGTLIQILKPTPMLPNPIVPENTTRVNDDPVIAKSSVDLPPQSLQPDEDASHGDATSASKKVPSSKKVHHN